MAKNNNLVVKLLLEDKEFTKNLGLAQKDVKNFGDKVSSVTGVMGKMAGALGVATTAYEAFNKMMNSSQAISDKFNNSIGAATTAVDNFFYSIANGDFTMFFQGINQMIDKAYQAQQALDQLGNTKIAYNFLSGINNTGISEALTTMKDTEETAANRAAAASKARELLAANKEMAEVYMSDARDAISKVVASNSTLAASDVTVDLIKKIIGLDVSGNRTKLKADLEKEYQEYMNLATEVNARHSTTGYMTQGTAGSRVAYSYQTDANRAAAAPELAALATKYKEAIAYNTILNKWSDSALQENLGILTECFRVMESINSQERSVNKASNTVTKAIKQETAAIVELKTVSDAVKAEYNAADMQVSKGGELGILGVMIPHDLDYMTEQTEAVGDYADEIDELSGALSEMFSVIRGGKFDLGAFASLMGTLIGGAIGGPGGAAVGGSLASGIAGMLRADTVTPTVTVRGSDLSIALKNYNNRMS